MQMQSGSTTVTMPFNGLPGSPTLTNPDMILPYDGEYDTTPPGQSTFTQDEWRDPLDMHFSLGPSQISPVAPSTPIIYGNGTMLSDIGEVTEAESTAAGGRKLPGPAERRMLKQAQANNIPIRSSPTIGYEAVMKRAKTGNHQRSVSIESTSTVTSEGHAAEMFRDFDDEVSVDDSNFQGDDEESVAESYRDPYREEVIGQETQRLAKGASATREEDDEDLNSSAALSRRAEQILLNAKKRLNNMEGNLTRARSSLFVTPSRSASSIHSSSPLSRSTPSPPVNQFSNGPSKHRQLNTPLDSPIGTPGHSRVYSENSINSSAGKGRFPVRSASAAARYIPNTTADGQRRLGVSYSSDSLREDSKNSGRPTLSSPLSRTSPPRAVPLEPLTEDDVVPEFDSRSVTPSIDGFISPSGEPRGLTRSASTTQMRDLRDQMHDLKGRLSVLRDRARDDTMKRRSLQSLRTPSPFTAAEQWYATDKGYQEDPLSADAGTSPILSQAGDQTNGLFSPNTDSSGQDGTRDLPDFEGSDVTSVYEDIEDESHFASVPKRSNEPQAQHEKDSSQGSEPVEEEMEEEGDYVDEIVSVEEAEDYESDNTLYHDTLDHPISHEDREDAFDYEHFFLHSAMGTIGAVARNRRDSYSSEDSVETTRGPTLQKPKSPQKQAYDSRPILTHLRSGSNASVSTIESFATAEEDPSSGEEDVDTPREEKHQDFTIREARQASTLKAPSPTTVKRSTFGGSPMDFGLPEDVQTISDLQEPPLSAVHKPEERDGTGAHRSSVSSFDSCSSGSMRSFPLVNKPKIQEPVLSAPATTASRGSGGSGGSLVTTDSATLVDRQSGIDQERLQTSPVHMLAKDDQILVERLVASLGKCVLGLQEADRGTYESRVWRRRLDAARRVLEGTEGAI